MLLLLLLLSLLSLSPREGRASARPISRPIFLFKVLSCSLYRPPYFNPSTGDPLSSLPPPAPRTVLLPSLRADRSIASTREARGMKRIRPTIFFPRRHSSVEWSRIPFLINADGSRAAPNTDNLASSELIGPALSLRLGRIDRNGERDCASLFLLSLNDKFKWEYRSWRKGKRKFSISPVLKFQLRMWRIRESRN